MPKDNHCSSDKPNGILIIMIEIENLHKHFEDNQVLKGIDLKIDSGETLVIIGSSGCGKSVLLKHIVGLLTPDEGNVKVEGQIIDKLNRNELYKLRKKIGFLFQGSALFDSMTVEENVALPLVESNTGQSEKEIELMVSEKLELVGMSGSETVKPAELSGGMKKRVALARALVTNPEYIFYDEPTTGLDPIMSNNIDNLIKELSGKLNVTSVVVTHDMYSVKNVASSVAMIYEGKIYFHSSPHELLNSKDKIITDFIARTCT